MKEKKIAAINALIPEKIATFAPAKLILNKVK
jgi:hypothetical protein